MREFFHPTNFFTDKAEAWLDEILRKPYRQGVNMGRETFDRSLLDADPPTAELLRLVGNDVRGRVIKTLPGMLFDWHVDSNVYEDRQCVLNMLLTPGVGTSLFRKRSETNVRWFEVTELKYDPNRWYLLNTSMSHCFMNTDPAASRYVISLDIKGLNYEQALEILS